MINDNNCFILTKIDPDDFRQVITGVYLMTREEFEKQMSGMLDTIYTVYEAKELGQLKFNAVQQWIQSNEPKRP